MVSYYVKAIEQYLKEFKLIADDLAQKYEVEEKKISNEIDGMHGKYTEEYIKEYENKVLSELKTKYQGQLKSAKTRQEYNVPKLLKVIENEINRYFMSPASENFTSAINLITASGMELTAAEMQFLNNNAKTYFEKRAINQLIQNNSSLKENETYFTGEGYYKHHKNEIPDMGAIQILFKQFSKEATEYIDNYTGNKMILSDEPMSSKNTWVASTRCHFFDNATGTKLLDKMQEAFEMCDSKEITKLTEQEKNLIDILVDEKYPSLAGDRVKIICKNSPELASLFIVDDRYSKYACDVLTGEK